MPFPAHAAAFKALLQALRDDGSLTTRQKANILAHMKARINDVQRLLHEVAANRSTQVILGEINTLANTDLIDPNAPSE